MCNRHALCFQGQLILKLPPGVADFHHALLLCQGTNRIMQPTLVILLCLLRLIHLRQAWGPSNIRLHTGHTNHQRTKARTDHILDLVVKSITTTVQAQRILLLALLLDLNLDMPLLLTFRLEAVIQGWGPSQRMALVRRDTAVERNRILPRTTTRVLLRILSCIKIKLPTVHTKLQGGPSKVKRPKER